MILSIRRNRGCSGGFAIFRNPAAIPLARMVAIQPEMVDNPATVRDIKTLESANETRDPASIHRYDGPVPLTARSTLVELVQLYAVNGWNWTVRQPVSWITWIGATLSPAE